MDNSSIKTMGTARILRNGSASAVIDTHGAKVLTLTLSNDDILYYDPRDIGHSGIPLCFPSFGPLSDGIYNGKDRGYRMGQHGFFRDRLFRVLCCEEDRAILSLHSTPDDLACFPYEFEATVTVILESDNLRLIVEITNLSNETMPLSPGFHPYFVIRNGAHPSITTRALKGNNNLIEYEMQSLRQSGHFSETGTYEGTPLYEIYGAPDFHLINHTCSVTHIFDGDRHVRLHTDTSFNRMTIWRKTDTCNYLCVEPASVKNGINDTPTLCPPGGVFTAAMAISR